jgi:hypothetical protein
MQQRYNIIIDGRYIWIGLPMGCLESTRLVQREPHHYQKYEGEAR